jgi:hypothetical protein
MFTHYESDSPPPTWPERTMHRRDHDAHPTSCPTSPYDRSSRECPLQRVGRGPLVLAPAWMLPLTPLPIGGCALALVSLDLGLDDDDVVPACGIVLSTVLLLVGWEFKLRRNSYQRVVDATATARLVVAWEQMKLASCASAARSRRTGCGRSRMTSGNGWGGSGQPPSAVRMTVAPPRPRTHRTAPGGRGASVPSTAKGRDPGSDPDASGPVALHPRAPDADGRATARRQRDDRATRATSSRATWPNVAASAACSRFCGSASDAARSVPSRLPSFSGRVR